VGLGKDGDGDGDGDGDEDGDGILSHICGVDGNMNDSTNRTLESRNSRMRQRRSQDKQTHLPIRYYRYAIRYSQAREAKENMYRFNESSSQISRLKKRLKV